MGKIDLTLNAPKSKRDLTKENMLDFIKKSNKKEDKTWFKKLMKDNQVKKTNNLTGEITTGYNYTPIREAFASRFFPNISNKAKAKKTATKTKKTFEEELEDL